MIPTYWRPAGMLGLYTLLFIAVVPKTIALSPFFLDPAIGSEFSLTGLFETNVLTNSLRYGGVLLGMALELVIGEVGDALAIVRDSNQDPNAYLAPKAGDPRLNALMASLAYRFVVMLPLLAVAIHWLRPAWAGALFLIAMFAALGGYGTLHDFISRDLYWAVFPSHSWYLFDLREGVYYVDFLAIGFLPLLTLVIANSRAQAGIICLITALGQISYEHFGFVSGVAAFVFILMHRAEPGRLKQAWRVLVLAGLVSVACLVVLVLPGLMMKGDLVFVSSRGTGWGGFIAEAASNRANWKHVLVRMTYLLAPSVLGGALVGALLGLLKPNWLAPGEFRTRFTALTGVLVAFSLATLIGFFALTNFSSEMGREFLQIMPILFLFALHGAYFLGARVRR